MSGLTRRSHPGAGQRACLTAGRVEMQVCAACAHVQYPPADCCRACLGDELAFAPVDPAATVIATTLVHRSYRDDFATGGPWPIATVRLATGATVFAHVLGLLACNTPVTLIALRDKLGEGVFGAVRALHEATALQARFEADS
ncbi:MAG: Zn-ribbon domain-containing OB-fold protein [Gammaproteobacteria bacterium]